MKTLVEYLYESLNRKPNNFKQFGNAFFDAIINSNEYSW